MPTPALLHEKRDGIAYLTFNRPEGESPMGEPISYSGRRALVDRYLTEVSLLAKESCPEAKVEATLESYEDEDGHVRIYLPVGLSERQREEIEAKIADRCVDILVETGVFLCAAVYELDE